MMLKNWNEAIESYSHSLTQQGVRATIVVAFAIAQAFRGDPHHWGPLEAHNRGVPRIGWLSRHNGDIDLALAEIDDLLSSWNGWSEQERQGVRVVIATHPAMERLRAHPGLLSLLYRHMGSTAPARMR